MINNYEDIEMLMVGLRNIIVQFGAPHRLRKTKPRGVTLFINMPDDKSDEAIKKEAIGELNTYIRTKIDPNISVKSAECHCISLKR